MTSPPDLGSRDFFLNDSKFKSASCVKCRDAIPLAAPLLRSAAPVLQDWQTVVWWVWGPCSCLHYRRCAWTAPQYEWAQRTPPGGVRGRPEMISPANYYLNMATRVCRMPRYYIKHRWLLIGLYITASSATPLTPAEVFVCDMRVLYRNTPYILRRELWNWA